MPGMREGWRWEGRDEGREGEKGVTKRLGKFTGINTLTSSTVCAVLPKPIQVHV